MPIDPLFTSAPKRRRTYTDADRAEQARLKALPFEAQRAEYRRLKTLVIAHTQISPGEFLFVRDIDQKRNWRKRRDWDKCANKYLGGNVKSGAYTGHDSHARYYDK